MSNKSRRNSSGPSGHRSPAPQPANSSGRATLERLSAPWLVRLHSLPRWLVPVGLASLLFVGLLLAGDWAWLGAIFLAIIGLFITWLTALSWPILTGSSRMIRVVVAVVIFGLAVLKLLGRW